MIFLILGEDAEKAFLKLHDRYVGTKRKLKKKMRSSTPSVDKLNERLESVKFLAWLNSYAKPIPARYVGDMSDKDKEEITDVENNLNFTQSDRESDKNLSPQSKAVTSTKIKSSTLQK